MLGLEQLSQEDRNTVFRARRLERFLTQPFFTTKHFKGMDGKKVSLDDALDGCERPRSGASYEPAKQRLLPLDQKWQSVLGQIKWPTIDAQLFDLISGFEVLGCRYCTKSVACIAALPRCGPG
jgi:hypothetical protein